MLEEEFADDLEFPAIQVPIKTEARSMKTPAVVISDLAV